MSSWNVLEYSPGAGAVECTSCEEGRFVSRERATACDLASGGEYVATTGATKPFECTAGRFSGSGASSCEPCEPGTVSDAGASACTLADAGEYTNRHPTYVLTLQSELTLEGYLVDLLGTTASPHTLFPRRPTGGNPTASSTSWG